MHKHNSVGVAMIANSKQLQYNLGQAGDQKVHYHACAEVVANDLYGCGHKLNDELPTLQTCRKTGLLNYFSEHCWHDHTV